MDLSRYAKHLRGAAVDLRGILADSMRVMAPRVRGYAKKAMPKRTGLLSRSMDTIAEADALTLRNVSLSGPVYRTGRGSTGALIKYVDDYAAERGGKQAVASMQWAQRQVVRLVRAAMRKRIASDRAGGIGGV